MVLQIGVADRRGSNRQALWISTMDPTEFCAAGLDSTRRSHYQVPVAAADGGLESFRAAAQDRNI